MLKTILEAFTWHSRKRMPALPAEFWSKVKVRWRHNPGFVAAAAAGSIGLVLAVALGIQGAFRLLDGEPTGDDLAEGSSSAALGEPDNEFAGTGSEESDPWQTGGVIRNRTAPRRGRNVLVIDELNDDLDDEAVTASESPKMIAARAARTQKRDPFEMDEEQEAEEQPVRVKPRARHVLDENPLADEEDPPRKTVQFPVEVADEAEMDDADVEPAKVAAISPANESPADKLVKRQSNSGPSFGGEEPEETEDDATDDSSASAPPAANVHTPHPPGWKHPLSRPDPATESSTAVAQKSRAVETVIYATPDAGTSTAVEPTAAADADEVAPARLTLEIAGPRSARIGETCNFEVRVKNPGRTAVEKITLSVELPAELVHEVAQSLEQKVDAIGPGKTYRALVRTRAKAAGQATLNTDVAIQGRVDAKSSAKIEIGSPSGARAKTSTPVR